MRVGGGGIGEEAWGGLWVLGEGGASVSAVPLLAFRSLGGFRAAPLPGTVQPWQALWGGAGSAGAPQFRGGGPGVRAGCNLAALGQPLDGEVPFHGLAPETRSSGKSKNCGGFLPGGFPAFSSPSSRDAAALFPHLKRTAPRGPLVYPAGG